jgi:hypothetical protein
MKNLSFPSITIKSAIVHTVSYFVIGFISFTIFDYTAKYADPLVANLMRQTDHPLIAAGPLFQLIRGFLFGIVFYALREIVFLHKRGWLIMWLTLTIVGIISPFGPSPSSIEGVLYTILPTWFHLVGIPEVFIQAGLLSFLTFYWVNHPEKKWLSWVMWILLAIVALFSILGTLSALGYLPQSG